MFEEETKYGRHLDVEHFVLVFLVPSAEFEPYNQANRMIIAYFFFVWRWISLESAFENDFFR